MRLKSISGVILIILFIFIVIGTASANDNATSDALELNNNEDDDVSITTLDYNSSNVLEKTDEKCNSIEQKSDVNYNNTLSMASDNSILSYSNNGVEINHVATYTIKYNAGSRYYSTSFTLNDLESIKNGMDFNKDGFTIIYSKLSSGEHYAVYYSGLEGTFASDFTTKLAQGETVAEDYPSSYYVFNPNLWIHCDLNYYTVKYNGYSGKYSSKTFENFIKGTTNYIHADTGVYKTTKEAQYKTKWTKKWFYVGKVVLKKKVKYVNGLKIIKRNNINYLTIGKVKREYNKVVKVVNKYKKVNKKLLKNGWEFEGHILKKVKYRHGKTTIKYYYKYEKSYEVFKRYKYYKNPCSMTLEWGSNGKKIVSVWYSDKAEYDNTEEVSRRTFVYSIS